MHRLALVGVAAAIALSLLTGVADASTFTLGSTTEPSGATPQACIQTGLFAQSAGDAPTLYVVPGGGQITQWQTNTAGDTAGAAIKLVALTPEAGGIYRVDATDSETVPNPAGGVATFTPASPMMVSDGDILGIIAGSNVMCYWSGGSTPTDDEANIFGALSEDPGDAYSSLGSGPFAVNVDATLVATEDSAVTTTADPSTVSAGGVAVLASTVTDHGPASNPLTFTDAVPSGLKINSVLSPGGPCTTLGQVVTCTISGLTAGQSAPVGIVVTVPAGSYTNQVTVAQPSAVTDPVSTDNTATAKFTAPKPTVAKCVVPNLADVPLGTAKTLLGDLSCKVGKVTKSYSKRVVKGDVIKTSPGKGSYTAKKSIAITESKGPEPRKHKKK
jgi:Domain of unknown function DUF11/PASTA domain